MRNHSDAAIEALAAAQEQRNASLRHGAPLTRDERRALEVFWNTALHARRDRVPLVAALDREVQRVSNDPDHPIALRLARARFKALMNTGYLWDALMEWSSGKVPSGADLQLNNEGVAYFASSLPAAMRNPMLFAQRHLSFFQLMGVAVSVSLALATFLLRLFTGA